MSQYYRGFYEATAARHFQDAMDAVADASLALVDRGHNSNTIAQYEQAENEWKAAYDEVHKRLDDIAGQRDDYYNAIKVFQAVLKNYYQRGITTKD